VTCHFFRPKARALALPRACVVRYIVVADIGLPPAVLVAIRPATCQNTPALWRPAPTRVAITSIPRPCDRRRRRENDRRGALRRGRRRMGAGLLTLAVPAEAVAIYAVSEVGGICRNPSAQASQATLADPRPQLFLIGPGVGIGAETRRMVATCLASIRRGAGRGCPDKLLSKSHRSCLTKSPRTTRRS